ncbi:MAG TPA: NAD-dependent epimerase/dehydratase family protein, partial [Erysipelotrichaceae bacterium]|nr:NAD-dependent epimerase/dehydratase family protein [Erysipelotrichaceae bacterium]
RVVSNFIIQALKNDDITLYGDGMQTRSFCYIDDLIEGLIKMMGNNDFNGPVNLGNPHEMTVYDLAKMIIEKTGSASRIVYMPLPADDPVKRKPAIELAKSKLYWQPEVSISEGLDRTIDYFKTKLDI